MGLAAKRIVPRVLLSIGLTATLFLFAEILLRITSVGYPADFFLKETRAGESCCVNNIDFSLRFFPRSLRRESEPVVFREKKTSKTVRIFVLGSSAAKGDPGPAFGFPRFLSAMLKEAYPSLDFEVINTAVTAYNSNVIREIAKDAARLAPDFFVVYLGNNEVIGPFGPGSAFGSRAPGLWTIRASVALKRFRVGQAVQGLIDRLSGKDTLGSGWAGMQMFLKYKISKDAPALAAVYKHLAANLRDIVAFGEEAEAEVILCTVPVNIKDSAPFASVHGPKFEQGNKKRFDDLIRKSRDLLVLGRPDKAVDTLQAAMRMDNQYADVHYLLGKTYLVQGNGERALDAFLQALDLDALRFRADTRINGIIADIARSSGKRTRFVDLSSQFREGRHIPGNDLFYEHVHLSPRGNYRAAAGVFAEISPLVAQKHGMRAAKTPPPQEICERRLAYTGWNELLIAREISDRVKQAPFATQVDHVERLKQLEEWIAYLRKFETHPEIDKVVEQYNYALSLDRTDGYLNYNMGKLMLNGMRDLGAAKKYMSRAIQTWPNWYTGHSDLGLILSLLGENEAAMRAYQRSLELRPEHPEILFYLGNLHMKTGQMDRAIDCYQRALKVKPNPSFYAGLAAAYFESNQMALSIDAFEKALALDPTIPEIHNGIGKAYIRNGQIEQGIEHLRRAIDSRPGSRLFREDLDRALHSGRH